MQYVHQLNKFSKNSVFFDPSDIERLNSKYIKRINIEYLDNNYTIHAVSIITIFSVIYLFARLFRWLSIRAMKRRNIHLLYRIPSTLSFRFLTEGMKCCFFLSLMVLPWLDSIGVINLNQIQSDLLVNDSFVPDVYSIFYQVVFMSFKQIRDKHLDYKFIISSVEN